MLTVGSVCSWERLKSMLTSTFRFTGPDDKLPYFL